MQLAIILKYEQLFDDIPLTIKEYVCMIGKRITLQLCTHFMYRELQDDQQNVVDFWRNYFCHDNYEFANKVIDQLEDLSKVNRITIIHTQNLYMLIEAALSDDVLDEKSPSPSNKVIEQAFFKALLVANNLIQEHQDEGLEKTEKYCLENQYLKKSATLILINQLAYGDYEYALNDEVAITQLYRAVCFFKYAEEHYPIHLNYYLKEKGFSNWKEYVRELSGIAFNSIKKRKGTTYINIPQENNDKALDICVSLSSGSIHDKTEDLDFIELRNRPLYRWEENEFLILSNLFLSEKLYQGIYFDFKIINDHLPVQDKISDLKSEYGIEFSERTLLYEVLNRLFRDNVIKKTGKDIEESIGDGGCDYYARSGSKVFIFESKDYLMPKSTKTSYDASLIVSYLYGRFVHSGNSKKAVEQLLQNIQFVRENKMEPSRSDGGKMTIYPIIVTHHRVFDTPAINFTVNQWFLQKLNEIEIVHKERIKPVVMMNIDTLIMMKDLCHQRAISFSDLLDEYIASILRNEKVSLKNSYLSFADKMHDKIFSTHQFPKGAVEFAKILFTDVAL